MPPDVATAARRDLIGRSDVHDLVVGFYREVVFDELLAPVFGEVAEVDWSVHIPKLIDYWCRVLFGEPSYVGSILGPHRDVHVMQAFEPAIFDRWYSLWVAAIDLGWAGPTAARAKEHVARTSAMLSRQLLGLTWTPPAGGGPPLVASPPVERGTDRADLGGEPACWAHLIGESPDEVDG